MRNAVRALGIACLLLAATAIWMSRFNVPDRGRTADRAGIILALELPRSVDELRRLARSLHEEGEVATIRQSLAADHLLIVCYWLVLAGIGFALGHQRMRCARPLGFLAMLLASVAALCDGLENHLIGVALERIETVDEAFRIRLWWASMIKWLAFFGATGLASLAFLSRRGLLKGIGILFALAAIAGFFIVDSRALVFRAFQPFGPALLGAAAAFLLVPGRFLDTRPAPP